MSLLAPCVLPILPLIVGGALKTSKWRPLLCALGLTLSFTLFGILTSAFASTFDPDVIRKIGAVILIIVGLIFLVPSLKLASSGWAQKVSDLGVKFQNCVPKDGLLSEFFGGALLGMIWSPCTGPTLAVAVGLASQSKNLVHASLVFFFFGLGAGIGLVSLGLAVKRFSFLREKLLKTGALVNAIAGGLSLIIGILILTGLEGDVQEYILRAMPEWLISLTVKI